MIVKSRTTNLIYFGLGLIIALTILVLSGLAFFKGATLYASGFGLAALVFLCYTMTKLVQTYQRN